MATVDTLVRRVQVAHLPPIDSGHGVARLPVKLMKELGYNKGYRYDHDYPDAFSGQEFFPDELAGPKRPNFYQPNERGFEREVLKRLAFWDARREQGSEET